MTRGQEQFELAYEGTDMPEHTIFVELAPGLSLPAKTAPTQTYGFIARKGAGKTYAASKLVEQMIGIGAPCVVIDPVGNWYGLRLAADGKKPGLPVYVFGGMHGDLPLDIARGEDVAHVIMERGISAVVDVSGMRKNERKRFVTAFAERLFHDAKSLRTPRVVVFEEAQVFAPQRATGGDEARLLGAVEDIVRLGRNYGLGSVLISQRPQSVSKEVLNQVELLAVGQLSGPQERKAIGDWVRDKAIDDPKLLDQLPSLPVGTMVAWSPQWLGLFKRVRIGKKLTYDASATPELGAKAHAVELAPVDVASVQGALDELGAADTKPSRAAGKGKANAVESAVDKVAQGEIIHLRAEVEQLRAQLAERDEKLSEAGKIVHEIEQFTGQLRERVRALPVPPTRFAASPEPVYSAMIDQTSVLAPLMNRSKPAKPTRAQAEGTGLPTGALAMLRATATFPGTLTKAQISRACNLTIRGGTFRTYWSKLSTSKYVEATGQNTWGVTSAGFKVLGTERPSMGRTFEERLAYWTERIPAGAVRILDEAIKAKRALSRSELAERCKLDAAGGTFRTYVSLLTTNRLLERLGSELSIHPWLLTGASE